ncbi:hypothetical protein [Salinicoccus kekensis]|uniref:Uncharacterized protein n=1 Tax=Salinicoccus kekensis TaxID=714307 RepID=A0A285UC54_9STAP|nr:hypothetical protein [Salinicoccus kekensis]SOC39389.1 hypothetical protein SAMN05878391_0861 [Salinicoccus kekensis]
MNFKKYLLAGGLASILVLGACGDDAADESAETLDTEGGTEVDDEGTSDGPVETIQDSGESVDEDEIDHDSTETETEADNTADDAGDENPDEEDSE